MEAKEFEKFYSLCERTVSRQRLLGADNKDIAFVLTRNDGNTSGR